MGFALGPGGTESAGPGQPCYPQGLPHTFLDPRACIGEFSHAEHIIESSEPTIVDGNMTTANRLAKSVLLNLLDVQISLIHKDENDG